MDNRPQERILIITPAKDEAEFIEQTIHSLSWQTHRPAMWVIVNDGSSDRTGEIADAAAARYPWIKVLHRESGTQRRVGPGVIEAFYDGLAEVNLEDYDYVCKMDADIHLPQFYFADIMARFRENPRLGTCSGKCFIPVDGELVLERTGDEFSHGTVKLFRRECFEQIGGFVRQVMWDGIDCHRCRMFGWDAISLNEPQLAIIHLRQMGSSHLSILHGRRRWGRGQYFMGTHFAYLCAISLYRMLERPWVLGGLNIFIGYVSALVSQMPRYDDLAFRKHLHQWQWAKLVGMFWPFGQRTRPAFDYQVNARNWETERMNQPAAARQDTTDSNPVAAATLSRESPCDEQPACALHNEPSF